MNLDLIKNYILPVRIALHLLVAKIIFFHKHLYYIKNNVHNRAPLTIFPKVEFLNNFLTSSKILKGSDENTVVFKVCSYF